MTKQFTEKDALLKLNEKIGGIEWFANASVGRIPEMDVEGFYTFSVMPETAGKSGEVIYMVGQNRILTSGNADDFVWLLNKLSVGKNENAINILHFVHLFLRMKVGRQGVLLYESDGHILLKPDKIPKNKFSKPSFSFNENGANYTFWIFDTTRFEPVFYSVSIFRNGEVEYETIE